MTKLSWADVAIDKDYTYATTEIFHYIHAMERDGTTFDILACALLERAQGVMNYQDPWDGMVDGQWQHDREFVQLNRLMNFMEVIAEFAEKRLTLLHTGDSYMEQKIAEYNRVKSGPYKTITKNNTRNAAEKKNETEYDTVIDLIEDLEQDLITQGIARTTLAKTLLDCAFVYAKLQSVDRFITFCSGLKSVLGRDDDMSKMLDLDDDDLFEGEPNLFETSSIAGSTMIH